MYSIGIDPDLHNTALALTSSEGVHDLLVVRVPLALKGREAQEAMVSLLSFEVRQWLEKNKLRDEYYLPDIQCIVAEGQKIYPGGKTKNWDSVMVLGAITGAAASACTSGWKSIPIFIPQPKQWKGDVPKHIHQARVLSRRGVGYVAKGGKNPYCVPEDTTKLPATKNTSDWKHLVDAIGLADWGLLQ
jgi:hypothetical protein